MPRNGSGVYSAASGTAAVSNDPISSSKYNAMVADFVADANAARPVVAGGTGASSASGARTNFGLEIGTNVQAQNANLSSLAGLTLAADKGLMSTGANTVAMFDLTAAGLALLDDANAAAQRTTLGLGGAALVDVIDEDDFATDSATRPPSQQSTAAYVTALIESYRPAIGILDGTGTPSWTRRKGFAASVTKNSTGNYSVTFTSALNTANFIVHLDVERVGTGDERLFANVINKATTGFDIVVRNFSNVPIDYAGINVTVHWP